MIKDTLKLGLFFGVFFLSIVSSVWAQELEVMTTDKVLRQMQSMKESANLTEDISSETVDGNKIDHYVYRYPNGNTSSEFTIVNGLLSGKFSGYHGTGDIHTEANYSQGVLDGPLKQYYFKGPVESIEEFKAGKAVGPIKYFDENGKLKAEGTQVNGLVEGEVQRYKNGRVDAKFNYHEGKAEGEAVFFQPDGTIKAKATYVQGAESGFTQSFDEDGQLVSERQVKDGKISGLSRYYFPHSSIVMTEKHYEGDNANGEAKRFYRNGQVKMISNYDNNILNGPVKLFDPKGALIADFVYDASAKTVSCSALNVPAVLEFPDQTPYEEAELVTDIVGVLTACESFDQLEKIMKDWRQTRKRARDGVYLFRRGYDGINRGFGDLSQKDLAGQIKLLERWKAKYPQSVTAQVALLDAHVNLAWEYRGGGYANTISKSGKENFEKYLETAYQLAKDGMLLEEKDPQLYSRMMTVCRGLDKPYEEVLQYLQLSIAIDPVYFPSYTSAMKPLLPWWGGSAEATVALADQSVEATKKFIDYEMYALMAISVLAEGQDRFSPFPFEWNKIKRGMESLLRKYPQSSKFWYHYAWFSRHFEDQETATEIQPHLNDIPWDEETDKIWTYPAFKQWSQWAGGGVISVASSPVHNMAMSGDLASDLTQTTTGPVEEKAAESQEVKEEVPQAISPELLNVVDDHGRTPLMVAIDNFKFKNALFLIDQGADIKVQDKDGQTALHFAAIMGNKVVAGVLLSKGALVESKDAYGYAPLHWAAQNGFEEIVDLMVRERGVKIDEKSNGGWTPLYLASQHGHIRVVDLLIKKGANPNIADDKGLMPLHAAAEKGYLDVVKMLVEGGADINKSDKKGLRPRDYALQNKYHQVYDFLKKEERKIGDTKSGWGIK